MRFEPGTRVDCAITKWGGRQHWTYQGSYLGSDRHGDWLGFPAGTRYVRPGKELTLHRDHVGLVPVAAWHLATFYDTEGEAWPELGSGVQTYVDITTPAQWRGAVLHAVDLDLDVVRGFNGRVVVDDEDEFAEHQVAYGYPEHVIAAARTSCARQPPYEGSHSAWLAELARLV